MASFENFKEQMKNNWKPILWGLIPFVIVVVVFAIPLKEVPVQVTESYWATEIKDEPYTVTETNTVTEPDTVTETKTETIFDSGVNAGNWSYTFDVKKPNATVSINVYGYSYPYPQYYFGTSNDATMQLYPFRYFSDNTSRAAIKISYPEQVTKYRTVTKTMDVVKYRQVPTQALKERKVTDYVVMSLWAYIFFEQPE
jgi:hypothetical protein